MNINNINPLRYTRHLLNERILPFLTLLQQKIVAIASSALSRLATCYQSFRYYFRAVVVNADEHGTLNGKGKRIFKDKGIIEEGYFKNSLLEGQGTRKVSSFITKTMIGEFHEGHFLRGTIDYSNGDKAQGEFSLGLLHGKGEYIHSNGETRKGTFDNGNLHGKGVRILEDGTRLKGQFKDDSLVFGTKTYPDGKQEIGKFDAGFYVEDEADAEAEAVES